jgi:hypothetical protein
MHVVRAVATSLMVLFCTVELIVVPVTTGLPAGKLYVPEPLNGMSVSSASLR